MSIPELVIPVRLDTGAAVKGLGKLGAAGKTAGDDVAAGMKAGEAGASRLEGGLVGLMKAQIGLSTIKAVGGAIGDEFKRSAEYTKRLAEQFVELQKRMQSVAALSGQTNTAGFTVSEAEGAGRAHVTPQEYRNFRDKFLSRASTYIGDGKDAKMTEDEARTFQEKLAEFAQSKGIGQEDMANFAGGLLAQKKGKTSAKEMLAETGQAYAGIEAASKDPAGLLPGMTRIMAQGMSAKEASASLAQMPEIAPDEESTHLLRLMAEMRRNNLEGKGADFGMKKGTSTKQQLDDLVAKLEQDTGGDQDKLDQRLKAFTHEDIAANTLRGLVSQGSAARRKWKKLVEETPEDKIETTIAEHGKTDIGRRYAAESRVAVEEAKRGAVNAPVETELLEGKAAAVRSGELGANQGLVTGGARKAGSWIGGVDTEQQIVNESTLFRLRSQLKDEQIKSGMTPEDTVSAPENDTTTLFRSQESVNAEIRELARAIKEIEARREAREARRDARRDAPPVRVEPPPASKR